MEISRESSIVKALKLIEMFNNGPVVIKMIIDELGVDRATAYRWLHDASVVLPIYEEEINRQGPGRKIKEYKLLKVEDL
jgi:hypothetical protein